MAALNKREKRALGKMISPFEESNKPAEKKNLLTGESHRDEFEKFIHDAIDNHRPIHRYVQLTRAEIERFIKKKGRYQKKSFLWILDDISIKMIRERTPNRRRTHDPEHVCHTNLTNGGKAFAGGELFFGADGEIYVNYFSDRYGGRRLTDKQWQTILNYFRRVGYATVVDILDLLANED
jgi:hypothetical protein